MFNDSEFLNNLNMINDLANEKDSINKNNLKKIEYSIFCNADMELTSHILEIDKENEVYEKECYERNEIQSMNLKKIKLDIELLKQSLENKSKICMKAEEELLKIKGEIEIVNLKIAKLEKDYAAQITNIDPNQLKIDYRFEPKEINEQKENNSNINKIEQETDLFKNELKEKTDSNENSKEGENFSDYLKTSQNNQNLGNSRNYTENLKNEERLIIGEKNMNIKILMFKLKNLILKFSEELKEGSIEQMTQNNFILNDSNKYLKELSKKEKGITNDFDTLTTKYDSLCQQIEEKLNTIEEINMFKPKLNNDLPSLNETNPINSEINASKNNLMQERNNISEMGEKLLNDLSQLYEYYSKCKSEFLKIFVNKNILPTIKSEIDFEREENSTKNNYLYIKTI